MATSLAAQLSQRTTLDSARLSTAKTLKHPPSFIFTPRHAATVSTADLHAIASNAWDQLATVDSFFERYHSKILGEQAKSLDRTSLSKEDNDKLNVVLDKVLRALSKHILLKPAGVVLEWLIRRFRVNDLNITALVALFLPYHTTAHFPSALNLIPEVTLRSTAFAPLIDARKSMQPIPLPDLIALLPPFSAANSARQFLDAILAMPLAYLDPSAGTGIEEEEKVPRPVVGFWLQVVAGYLSRAGTKLPDGERAAVLSTLLTVLKHARNQPDVLIAVYILLTRYGRENPLEDDALRVVMKAVVGNKARKEVGDSETDAAFVTTLVVLAQLGDEAVEVPEGKKFLGGTGWKALMRVQNIGDLLVQLANEYDATHFMKPFLHTLAAESIVSSDAAMLLSSLLAPRPGSSLTSPILLPDSVVRLYTASAFSAILNSAPDTDPAPVLRALTIVHQRWPVIWEAETRARTASTDEESMPLLWSIMNTVLSGGSLPAPTASSGASTSMFLASTSPDMTVRIGALRDVLKSADRLKSDGNGAFLHDTLLARLNEPAAEVQRVVLSTQTLAVLHSSLQGTEILRALRDNVVNHSTKNSEVGAVVLPYLAGPFVDAFPQLVDDVLRSVFWPRLLASKTSHAHGRAAIRDSKLQQSHPWLQNTAVIFNDDDDSKNNDVLIARIAENISGLHAEQLSSAMEFLVDLCVDTDKDGSEDRGELLALLVSAHLASKLDRSHRPAFIGGVLNSIKATAHGLDAFAAGQTENSTRDDKTSTLSQMVYSKTESHKTTKRARAALLASVVAALQPLKGSAWSWLAKDIAGSPVAQHRALVMSIYRLAHTGTTQAASALSTSLLRSLFSNLVTLDTLAFLASIFSQRSTPSRLRAVALQDAATFVSAQTSTVDFQTLVPAVSVALLDGDKLVRRAALDALTAIHDALPAAASTDIYGRDTFYGPETSTALKYLDVAATKRYLGKIVAARLELAMDGAYLTTVHSSMLEPAEGETEKKRATLKLKVATFLISHVAAWQSSLFARTLLLRSLGGVVDANKGALIVPVLEQIVKMSVNDRAEVVFGQELAIVAEFGRALVQPYGGASKKWLESTPGALDTFAAALELPDASGLGAVVRHEALSVLGASSFASIRGDSRLEMFKRLVRLAVTQDARVAGDVLACIRQVKLDVTTLTAFLGEVRTSMSSPISKGAKRGRTSIGGSSTVAAATAAGRIERLPELVVVLESIEFANVTVSHGLLLTLFELLSTLNEIPSSAQADIQYPGQLMLGALAKSVANVQPTSGVTGDSIRMTPVLDLMRSSHNPQTYQQALLLLAQLGPLVPDQLVHNVMPIFTFMGANVLQRDDAYSLRVVEKTLESIVPALVKSTKKSSANRNALVSDLKELLNVFADAAAHVPRHRRINLFVRFVQTLGPQEFLSAVGMLLISKDVKATDGSSLPLALFEHFSIDAQLHAHRQIISEASRILEGERSFLDVATPDVGLSSAAKEQVIALLHFVSLGLASKHTQSKVDAARAAGVETVDTALADLVRALLDLSVPPTAAYTDADKAELIDAASFGVHSAVQLMSVKSFSESITWLLELADPSIQARAFELLRFRLPQVKATRRPDISPAVVATLEKVRQVLAHQDADREGALETLDVIASSLHSSEDGVLVKTIPDLMDIAQEDTNSKTSRALALGVLTKLINRLGPRLIPLVAKIVPFAVDVLLKESEDAEAAVVPIVTGAFIALEALFIAVPNFIGAQIDNVLAAVLSPRLFLLTEEKTGDAAKARASLLSTAAKKLPAKSIFPAIIRQHAAITGTEKQPFIGLLDVLIRALRQGKSADIVDNYRSIFKLFLSVFDLRREHQQALDLSDISEIEDHALNAFVQFILKLNEQIFRPLFLRTYDWAVIDLAEEEGGSTEGLLARRIVLYKLMDKLLSQLKTIIVPYFSFMLDQTVELLDGFAKGEQTSTDLWTSAVSATTKAMQHDESGFWTPIRLSKLSTPIAHQLERPQLLAPPLVNTRFHPLVAQYAQAIEQHERLLKAFNTSLLMLTRSDDLRVKRGALDTLDVMWATLGDGMLGLVPETTPFLAETMDEGEGGVETATRQLVSRIETHLGESLESYLAN